MKEYKSLPMHVKAIEDRTVTTLFSVFGNVDSYGDIMQPGSFQRTFAERGHKILHLWQHAFDQPPIAKVERLREVSRDDLPPDVLRDYPDATGGAEATSTFLPTPRADEVLTAITAGVPLEASFGFDPLRFDFTEQDGMTVRNVREVKLYEVSTVLWGANSATTASKMPLHVVLRHLQTILEEVKAGKRHSDTDQKLIEQIGSLALDLGASNITLLSADEPKAATPIAPAATDEITEDVLLFTQHQIDDVMVKDIAPSLAELSAKLAFLDFIVTA
ncbi:MAG TPA: HK97 family phage prohead protease [Roseiflexaceae bacterium]|nr:HK97 family phage prohead protease [Roseiflexaceae bacterium]